MFVRNVEMKFIQQQNQTNVKQIHIFVYHVGVSTIIHSRENITQKNINKNQVKG